MPPPDDRLHAEALVSGLLTRVAGRVRAAASLEAAGLLGAVGGAASTIALLTGVSRGAAVAIGIAAGVVAAAAWIWRSASRWTPARAAALVEAAQGESRNLVITLQEILDGAPIASPRMRERIARDAAAVIASVPPSHVVRLGRSAGACAAGLALLAVATVAVPRLRARAPDAGPMASGDATSSAHGGLSLDVTIRPPAYTSLPEKRVADPERIEIVQGTTLTLRASGDTRARLRDGTGAIPMTPGGGALVAELRPAASTYIAIESDQGADRLIPVVVTPDRAPAVTVTAPGKDLLMPEAKGRVPLAVTATDDFGLRTLEVSYTKVSGTGEQFQFTSGTLPLAIARASATAWTATTAFDLGSLSLEPGDTVVYKASARDARPDDAGLTSSDTFFIEIAGPGMLALPGFELPPDEERYGLSQQMIVLKLRRLRVREPKMERRAVEEELVGLSAEQRSVRANFIFLLGGHVEDEEEEAEHSDEIQEGRLENTARREITTAIRYMGLAEQAMAAIDSGEALTQAKVAADALQRAFGRNRYFLRTVPVRSRIDPSRRLSGDLSEASDWQRPGAVPDDDAVLATARELLRAVLALAAGGQVNPREVTTLAERALAVDPASPDWQQVSARLVAVRDAIASGATVDTRLAKLQDAATPLAAIVRQRSARAGGASSDHTLRSAWSEEQRR